MIYFKLLIIDNLVTFLIRYVLLNIEYYYTKFNKLTALKLTLVHDG